MNAGLNLSQPAAPLGNSPHGKAAQKLVCITWSHSRHTASDRVSHVPQVGQNAPAEPGAASIILRINDPKRDINP